MNAGTTVNFGDYTVTVGKVVTLYPVSAYGYTFPTGPTSGALPCADGPQIAVVVSAYGPNLPGEPNRAKVKILAPGTPNNNRIVPVAADGLAD